jgi:hypothetical protein
MNNLADFISLETLHVQHLLPEGGVERENKNRFINLKLEVGEDSHSQKTKVKK